MIDWWDDEHPGRNNIEREIEAQIAVKLFGYRWAISGCYALFVVPPYGQRTEPSPTWGRVDFSEYKTCPTTKFKIYPKARYWQEYFPHYDGRLDEVISAFCTKHTKAKFKTIEKIGLFETTIKIGTKKWTAIHKKRSTSLYLVVLKALVSLENKNV